MIVTFGEVMGRFSPSGHGRLRQAMPGQINVTFGGAEANVAVSLSRLGMPARFITALPDNPLGEACRDDLRSHGVDVSGVLFRACGRLGLYFVERGANQRPSRVTYDRANSTVSITDGEAYDWGSLLKDGTWFHTTGITPAVSAAAAAAVRIALERAREAGLTVSMDLNFRSKLWGWESGTAPRELAGRVMRELLPYVDVLIGNEADASDVLGVEAPGSNAQAGTLNVQRYPEVAKAIAAQFTGLKKIAITLRESHSADRNGWGAMLYDVQTGVSTFAPMNEGAYQPYEIRNIVDRVGAGDAFAAGLIRLLARPSPPPDAEALSFAVAASCLAHSIEGDFNVSSFTEIETLSGGSGSGRVVR